MKKLFYLVILFSSASTIQINAIDKKQDNNITVIGIGRLGLCTVLCFERAGYNVKGVDIFPDYVKQLNNKTFTSSEPHVMEYLQNSKNFSATTNFGEGLDFSNIYFIVVATPTEPEKGYDHKYLNQVLSDINKRKVQNKHIVICCTVYPGYIATEGSKIIKDCKNTTLSYNPEFIAQGNIIQGFENPDIILIGEGSKEVGDRLEVLYKRVCKNNPKINRMSPTSAEITKISINCFITNKIAFANMIGDIADRTQDADKFAILHAVGGDSRIGSKYLLPGYGFGGPCFIRDNRTLGYYARQVGVEPLLPEATDESNKLHSEYMVEQMLQSDKQEYVFDGVTYKVPCAVPIIEESQRLIVAKGLAQEGKKVIIKDTLKVIEQVKAQHGDMFEYCEVCEK